MAEFKTLAVEEPIDLVKLCINEYVLIKMRHGRELRGKLHAFDQHFNCLLGDVEETYTYDDLDPQTNNKILRKQKRKIPMLFTRGDGIILISPQSKE